MSIESSKQLMLSVVIPAYNEADVIEETVSQLSETLDSEIGNYEILIVNDGSGDSTEKVLTNLTKHYSQLRYINNTGPHGYGFAVRYGLEHFRGDAAVILMADGSDAPQDVVKYYRKIDEGYDCAFGSRFIPGAHVDGYPWFKRILNRLGNRLIGALLGQRYDDFTNGFKCYRRSVIDRIQPLVCGQFNLTIEMSMGAVAQGARFAVVPTNWRDRDAGDSKFKVLAQVRIYLLTLIYCLNKAWLAPRIGRPAR